MTGVGFEYEKWVDLGVGKGVCMGSTESDLLREWVHLGVQVCALGTTNPFVVLDRAAWRDNRRGCRGPREVARARHDPGDEPIGG